MAGTSTLTVRVGVIALVLVLVLVLVSVSAVRQAVAATTADEPSAAQGLIGDAVAEYDAGHFEEARALFRTAHNQSPSARTLRGIGMASFELRDYVEATRTLTAALAERRRALTPDQRRHVEGLLARAEVFVGRFAVHLTPADARLFVDGKPAEREVDGTLLLSFGRHRVTSNCPTCVEVDREIEVVGGERQDLVLALASVGPGRAAAAGAEAVATAAAEPAPTEASSAGRQGPARYWLAGASVLSATGALAAGLWWRDRAHELDACRAAGDRCQNQSSVQSERNTAAGVTLGLAAAAVTTGIFAAVLWARRDPSPTRALACAAETKGVTCAIRF